MNSTLGKPYKRIRNALAWRIRSVLGDSLVDRTIIRVARQWRPFLKKPVFIGISGSAGKTTTKELLLGVLSQKMRGVGNPASLNMHPEVAKTILSVRRKHDFCVTELSEDKPGAMNQPLALLNPSIGIVTVVGDDHATAYKSREDVATEIGKLVASLPATGTAVLNADDEIVLAMASNCRARVITYGTSPEAELRAENISATWPDPLEFTAVHGFQTVRIRTRLCGSHFIPSVLGAIGGALATGMSLAECAEGIANVNPADGRMQPVKTADGVTFIRDDFKAPLWAIGASFEFMRAACATRKIIVIGMLSDVGSEKGVKYWKTATLAQEIAEITIFVGPWASSALKARKPGGENSLRTFSHVHDAAEYINSITRDGDLVLLKGSNKQDHLLRIILARSEPIACWRDDCARDSFCNECPHRARPSGSSALLLQSRTSMETAPPPLPGSIQLESDEQVIIGLGNPGHKYAGTPHNIGYEVVERLAASQGFTWTSLPPAWIARGSANGRNVCLIKIQSDMNLIGSGLKQLSEHMSFAPEQCILVFDDLDMPLGAVRHRINGGAGGHRGVASILEAFQTDAFRRVKIGVGKPGEKLNRIEYVLTVFDAASRTAIEQGIITSQTRILDMVATHPKRP
jgi:aminoacyl-tRNA hydrolase